MFGQKSEGAGSPESNILYGKESKEFDAVKHMNKPIDNKERK